MLQQQLCRPQTCTEASGENIPHNVRKGWLTLRRLLLSLKGSRKRQSRVGRPGSRPRSTDPSDSTSCFKIPKSCWPGLSDTYTAAPLTARAAACSPAAPCLLQPPTTNLSEHTAANNKLVGVHRCMQDGYKVEACCHANALCPAVHTPCTTENEVSRSTHHNNVYHTAYTETQPYEHHRREHLTIKHW